MSAWQRALGRQPGRAIAEDAWGEDSECKYTAARVSPVRISLRLPYSTALYEAVYLLIVRYLICHFNYETQAGIDSDQ